MKTPITAIVLALALAACGPSASATSSEASTGGETTRSVGSAEHPHTARVEPSAAVLAAIGAADRTAEDRALDAGRQPEQVLTFFRIAEGQRVVELFAGGGYTAELLARVVGPTGQVYAQNSAWVLDRFARAPLAARLERLAMPNVIAVERELGSPIPEDARDLDAVLFVLAYHDSVWMQTDRAAMNRAIFEALRPGGVYGIVDHAAAAGHGVADVQTLHRIERETLIAEVLAAGFVLEEELEALRTESDTHDWNASPREAGERRGTSDRFVLRFVRPLAAGAR